MKKILTIISLMILTLLPLQLAVAPAYAVNVLHNPSGNGGCTGTAGQACAPCDAAVSGASACDTPVTSNPIFGTHSILGLVIQILAVIIGILSVVSIIISGVRMITANGDPNSIGSAKKGIAFALIGLVIAVLAQAIVSLVINRV